MGITFWLFVLHDVCVHVYSVYVCVHVRVYTHMFNVELEHGHITEGTLAC